VRLLRYKIRPDSSLQAAFREVHRPEGSSLVKERASFP